MKKALLSLAVMAMLAMSFTACQKEGKDVVVYRVTSESGGDKAYMNNGCVNWEGNEEFYLFAPGTDYVFGKFPTQFYGSTFTVGDDPTWGIFTLASNTAQMAQGHDLYALYPWKIGQGNSMNMEVYFPMDNYQIIGSYALPTITDAPMAAKADANNIFMFKHLTGAIKLRVQNNDIDNLEGVGIYSYHDDSYYATLDDQGNFVSFDNDGFMAELSSAPCLGGAHYFQFDGNGNPTLSAVMENPGFKSITYNFFPLIDITEAKDIYFFLPPGTYNYLRIEFFTPYSYEQVGENTYYSKKKCIIETNSPITIHRNEIINFDLTNHPILSGTWTTESGVVPD